MMTSGSSEYPGLNPKGPPRLVCIQVEQQIPHNIGVGWECIVLQSVLKLRAPGVSEPMASVEDRGKEGMKCLCFVYVPVCEVTVCMKWQACVFSILLLFFCSSDIFNKTFLLSTTLLSIFNSSWALATQNFSLLRQTASLQFLQHHLTSLPAAICFFCLSSRRSLLSQTILLPCLLDLWCFRISIACPLRRWYLKNDQHCWTPLSSKAVLQEALLTIHWAAWSLLSKYPVLKFMVSFSELSLNSLWFCLLWLLLVTA